MFCGRTGNFFTSFLMKKKNKATQGTDLRFGVLLEPTTCFKAVETDPWEIFLISWLTAERQWGGTRCTSKPILKHNLLLLLQNKCHS